MNSWAQKRRFIYGSVVAVFLLVAVGFPLWKIFYVAPTCFDGKKNGSEQGVDCGGNCKKLCASDFIPPSNTWVKFEQSAPGLYNVAAYIVNPNTSGEAFGVPYQVELFDGQGMLITQFNGTFTLTPNRNSLAFKAGVNVGSRIPAKANFKFTAIPEWHKQNDRVSKIKVSDKIYEDDKNSSSLVVTLQNDDVLPVGPFSLYVVLYNQAGNAIGFSATRIDGIAAKSTVKAPYTWPTNRNGEVVSIEVLPVAE